MKNYHHALLRYLIPNISPHELHIFPFLRTLTPNRNDRSNYAPFDTAVRLGGVLASNYLGLPLTKFPAKDADLFHVTPQIWRLPRNICLTAMIHDPTPLLMPECHTAGNIRYFKRFVQDTVPHLDGILVPSRAVKQDLIQHLPVSPEKIAVVPHGVDEDFFETTPAIIEMARHTHKLPSNYILAVGTLEPRKNLTTLIQAFQKLPEPLRRQYPLVITGSRGWKYDELRRLASQTPFVHLTGYVRKRLLPAVYHAASLFVFPSLYEGFGLPLLEAMAARLPVISSNRSAMPEVVGEAGVLVDPLDADQMCAEMQRLLAHPDEAAALGETAHHQARKFTWHHTALRTKAFFENVYERAGN